MDHRSRANIIINELLDEVDAFTNEIIRIHDKNPLDLPPGLAGQAVKLFFKFSDVKRKIKCKSTTDGASRPALPMK